MLVRESHAWLADNIVLVLFPFPMCVPVARTPVAARGHPTICSLPLSSRMCMVFVEVVRGRGVSCKQPAEQYMQSLCLGG